MQTFALVVFLIGVLVAIAILFGYLREQFRAIERDDDYRGPF